MTSVRLVLCAAGLALVTGCSSDGNSITASAVLGQPASLAPGDGLIIAQVLGLRFDTVMNDSRCPIDAYCVAAGDALVRLTLGFLNPDIKAPILLLELHTGAGPAGTTWAASGTGYGYRFTLTKLEPEPRAGVPIPPRDYRAWIEVRPDTAAASPRVAR